MSLSPQDIQDMIPLYRGASITKLSHKGVPKRRTFNLTSDTKLLSWKSHIKMKSEAKVDAKDIISVTKGRIMGPYANNFNTEIHSRCLVVETSNGHLNLIFDAKKEMEEWCHGFTTLIRVSQHGGIKKIIDEDMMFALREWQRSKKDSNQAITFGELCDVFHRMNLQTPTATIKKTFKEVDVNRDNTLQFDEFLAVFERLRETDEINALFRQHGPSNIKGTMSFEQFHEFCRNIQGEDVSIEEIISIMSSYNISPEDGISLNIFTTFMLSEHNFIFNPKHSNVYHDMTRPLSHYFINSSHNTYLEGDQLKGNSSVDMYKIALEQGCRCVELDCWDGPSGPIIYHGHTLTSKIKFRDVIEAINEVSFKSSDFPVMLSIENHCTHDQQMQMAQIMRDIFKDQLATSVVGTDISELPSPQALKRKILIKGATLPIAKILATKSDSSAPGQSATAAGLQSSDVADDDDDDDDDDSDDDGQEKGNYRDESTATKVGGSISRKKPPKTKKTKEPKPKIAESLSSLAFVKNTRFVDFPTYFGKGRPYEISSFAELRAERLCETEGGNFIKYNQKNLSRIYPKGLRVDSSNYRPTIEWSRGCQVVALNYQTPDVPMMLNLGKFSDNGNCGYLLKPSYMLDGNYHPGNHLSVSIEVYIQILFARRLPKPGQSTKGEVIDPYVLLQVDGHPQDTFQYKTKYVQDNGYNPKWNERVKINLKRPEEAIFLFEIYDYDVGVNDDFIGYYSIPFTSIRTGYRAIPLKDKKHKSIPYSTLFCHIQVHDKRTELA